MSDPADTLASAPGPDSGPASSSGWRDASTWRRGGGTPVSSSKPASRFTTGRTSGGSSWRDREEKKDGDSSDFVPSSRPYDRAKNNRNSQKDDDGAAKAIAEGRRIYMGNLRYQAKLEDIEELLRANDLGHFTNIHISIDPFTGRNPSYCFVEFPDADSAKSAMEVLEGKNLLGREVKCRPCQPKGGGSGGKPSDTPNRWGHWSGEKETDDQSKPKSFDRYREDTTGRRLYVGGLPPMNDQATNNAEMTELFQGFNVETISKRVSAHESTREMPGNHDYCFVDLATAEEAQQALEALKDATFKGENLKVSAAKGRSNRWRERDEPDNGRTFGRREWGGANEQRNESS